MADDNAAVFVYTGIGEGAVVPDDVDHVRIDPSVLAIPANSFIERRQLQGVEFHDGLREIGPRAFSNCKALNLVQLTDGVESIGGCAFWYCTFIKFRIPPLVTTIPMCMLEYNKRLFSLELPEIIIEVEDDAFGCCFSLRNIALTSNTAVAMYAFDNCADLLHIFDTQQAIVNALRNRFDGLPIHSKMYYISYYPVVLEEIRNIIMSENGELDPTGLQQDCLGMTPLHILACSTVQCLELYQLLVEKYPENLIVEDAWGATPLLYAIWGKAPNEIVHFLINSYQSLYPDHEIDWNDMLITLGRANPPVSVIQNLLDVRQTLSPGYTIDWDQVLGVLVERTEWNAPHANPKTFCFLTRCSIVTRVSAIGVKHFRDAMDDYWMGDEDDFSRQAWHTKTLTQLEYYESEYRKLKEMTSLLELALWKKKIDNSSLGHGGTMDTSNKKMKMDSSEFRLQCRISCGADQVIENVLPYLFPPDFVLSIDDSSSNDDDDDDDEEEDDHNSDNDNGDDDDEEENDNYDNGEYGEVIDEKEEAL